MTHNAGVHGNLVELSPGAWRRLGPGRNTQVAVTWQAWVPLVRQRLPPLTLVGTSPLVIPAHGGRRRAWQPWAGAHVLFFQRPAEA